MINKEVIIFQIEDMLSNINKENLLLNGGHIDNGAAFLELMTNVLELLKEQEEKIEQLKRFVNGFSREAVPVVRCKDCKNGGMDSTSYPHYWCTRHTKYVRENYFCADGERR